jgi:hypothetical protein
MTMRRFDGCDVNTATRIHDPGQDQSWRVVATNETMPTIGSPAGTENVARIQEMKVPREPRTEVVEGVGDFAFPISYQRNCPV